MANEANPVGLVVVAPEVQTHRAVPLPVGGRRPGPCPEGRLVGGGGRWMGGARICALSGPERFPQAACRKRGILFTSIKYFPDAKWNTHEGGREGLSDPRSPRKGPVAPAWGASAVCPSRSPCCGATSGP